MEDPVILSPPHVRPPTELATRAKVAAEAACRSYAQSVSQAREDRIIAFLIRNAVPTPYVPVAPRDQERDPYVQVLLRLSGHTRYCVRLSDFEKFIGEPYDFEKHLRSIHDSGALRFHGVPMPDDPYDSFPYRQAFSRSSGLITDYSSESRETCVAFTLGREDPVEVAVGVFSQALLNLEALGVQLTGEGEKSRP